MELSRLLQYTTSALTPADRAYLDSPLTSNDYYWALQHTATGKTPGPDGLPLEYYKVDLPLWSRILEVCMGPNFNRTNDQILVASLLFSIISLYMRSMSTTVVRRICG